MPTVDLDPVDLSPGALYDILVNSILPRPIALVSTLSRDGKANLAPFSFFMAGGSNPPSLAFSPTVSRDGQDKDSLRNIEETGEFTVGVVFHSLVEGMNAAGYAYPKDYDEWPASGLTPVASDLVRPARVLESPIQFECRLFQIVRHGEGYGAARYVVGEIVRMHVQEEFWDGARQRLRQPGLVGRLGGARYIDLQSQEIFELARPTAPSASSGGESLA